MGAAEAAETDDCPEGCALGSSEGQREAKGVAAEAEDAARRDPGRKNAGLRHTGRGEHPSHMLRARSRSGEVAVGVVVAEDDLEADRNRRVEDVGAGKEDGADGVDSDGEEEGGNSHLLCYFWVDYCERGTQRFFDPPISYD